MKLCIIFKCFNLFFELSQKICKKCSKFSVENNWSDLISCISDEIIKTDNINDCILRVQCYGAIVQKTDSIILFINNIKKYYFKKDILNYTLTELEIFIMKDSLFANRTQSKQLRHIKRLLYESWTQIGVS